MLKIVLTIAVIAGVYYFLIKKPQVTQKRRERADAEAKKPKKGEEIMVECDKCGTYISTHEAIIKSGKYYCSKECAGVK
jgi:uncharacterized protein